MRRILAAGLVAVLTGCSEAPQEEPLAVRAAAFAATADRALAGTRFDEVPSADLAAALEALCRSGGSFDDALGSAVARLAGRPGDPADDDVAAEVLASGVVEVCPARVGEFDAYLDTVLDAVGAVGVDPVGVGAAGWVVCGVLEREGDAERALLRAIETLFDIAAPSLQAVTDAGLTPREGAIAGAVLASAVEHLCPDHRATVVAFIESLE